MGHLKCPCITPSGNPCHRTFIEYKFNSLNYIFKISRKDLLVVDGGFYLGRHVNCAKKSLAAWFAAALMFGEHIT